MAGRKFLTHIDLAQNELRNPVLQPLASAPSSPIEGQMYYNTGSNTAFIYDGTDWLDLGIQGGGSGVVEDIVAGTNIDVDSTDPANPIISVEALTQADIAGLTTADSPQLAGINLGHATDTTLTRSSAGVLAVEGVVVPTVSSTSTFTNKTIDANGTGNSITNLETADFAANVIDTDNALTADSDTRIPTQKAVKAHVAAAVTGLLEFKGSTDASANPNYPAASKGDAYVISVAGKIGGASGKVVEVGDMYVATADNAGGAEASVGTSWTVLEHNLQGALLSANNLSDVAVAATAFSNIKQAATTSATGVVELATDAETNTGTDTARAITPSNLEAWTGSAQVTTVGTLASGNATAIVDAASTTAAGKSELATQAEAEARTSEYY